MKKHPEMNGLRTWIEVDKKALAHNYKTLRGLLKRPTRFMAIVKSNAYGHSLIDFSLEIEKLGADWFGVDSIVEGLALRREGIKKPILVLGLTLPEKLEEAAAQNISLTVSTFEILAAISKANLSQKLKVHIKVDTGMHRQGFQGNDTDKVIAALQKLKDKIIVEGLFTHFGAAKNPAFPQRTHKQLELFSGWRKAFMDAGFEPLAHTAASSSAMIFPESHFDLVRFGSAMYGIWPAKEVEAFMSDKITLKPILTWKTYIGEIKKVSKGERVGYGFTEEFSRDSIIAVCPIGYWHGYPRALSSIGRVLVRGKKARVIGRVSMDMITIDITDIPGVKFLDEVVVIGKQGSEEVSAEQIADILDDSLYFSYELITRINPLIKRVIV